MFRNNTIAGKMTWMNVLVSGAVLLFACAAFLVYDIVSIQKGIVQNLSMQAQIAGYNSTTAIIFNDPNSAENTLSAFIPVPNVVSARIYTLEGQAFATFRRRRDATVPGWIPIPSGEPEMHRFTKDGILLERRIVFQGKPIGVILIHSDLSGLKYGIRRTLLIIAPLLAGSLLTALMISPLFRRTISEPISHLAETARIVSRDKNYAVRVTPTNRGDELSVLIGTFNDMLSQIQERDTALQQAHDQLEERVAERTRELAATNKELEAFAYSVSHDLRAPLRAIDGFSQALIEDYSDRLDIAGQAQLERVRRAAQRMSRLIDDILNLSRVTRSPIHREPLDLSAIARSIAEELRQAEPARHVEFAIQDGLTATGDSPLLRAALENLLRNSWKYTSGHASAKIEFGRIQTTGKSTFFVRDDGAGFDPRYADRLFGAFQRLHKEVEFSGTGIGLATVQRIIHKHGGEIWAEGAVEKGATFYFTL
jgi:signal transduction histidine kinase